MKRTMYMNSYYKGDVVLIHFPFLNYSQTKIRPSIIVNSPHILTDLFMIPCTSKIESLLEGEFILHHWREAGLNIETAVKTGYLYRT